MTYPPQHGQPHVQPAAPPSVHHVSPPTAYHQAPPQPTPRGRRRWLIPTVTAVAGLVVGSAAAGGSKDAGSTSAAAATVTVTQQVTGPASVQVEQKTVTAPAPAAPAAPAAAAAIPGDGTYTVGSDIKPGTYRSAKPGSGNCYWARLKDTSGGLGAILANANTSGQTTVTIKRTDAAFESSGCEDWTRVK